MTSYKPESKSYLVGVNRLKICNFESNNFIQNSINEGSLIIEKNYFIYPYGHALTIFKKNNNKVAVFDSLLGFERDISFEELSSNLEKPTTYLYLEEYFE